jgi:cupin 2 domain-containing protein
MTKGNLYENIPAAMPDELIEVLAEGSGSLRIERIVSRGHTSPDGYWYDQATTEWVVLLKGAAALRFEDEAEPMSLCPGDWLEIPAGRRHRVEATAADEDSVWLAVHF